MSSNEGTVYVLRSGSAAGPDGWISPEPVEDVVVDAIVSATSLDAADVLPLDTYVDRETLEAVVTEGGDREIAFGVEDHDVVVTAEGDVLVDGA